MIRLGLSLEPSKYETATSWVSRLAAHNFATHVQHFVGDMGVSWRAIIGGEEASIGEICRMAGVSTSIVMRYAKKTKRSGQTFVGATNVGSKFCQNNNMSICPKCILEWQSSNGELSEGAKVWWQAVSIRTCSKHDVLLIDLPKPQGNRCNYDFAGRVRDHISEIQDAAKSIRGRKSSEYEKYMMSRLCMDQSKSADWLDGMEVWVVANACQSLGLTLSNRAGCNMEGLSAEELSVARDLGFGALCQGPSAMGAAMRRAQDSAACRGQGFMRDFKKFHNYLNRMEVTVGSKRLKDAVRHYAINNYPTVPGEIILGRPADRRVIHSVLSASERANVSRSRLFTALRHIRDTCALPLLPPPNRHLWIPCKEWDPWLVEYGKSVVFKQAAKKLGVSKPILQQIVDAGWLKPLADFPKQVPRLHPSELQAFLERMLGAGTPVNSIDDTMISIERAPPVLATPLLDLLQLVWERRLKFVGIRTGIFGLRSIVLRREEVVDLLERPEPDGWCSEDARRHLHVSSITMTWLTRNQLIRIVRRPDHRTHRLMNHITPDAISDFLSKYETLGRIAHAEQLQAKSVLAKLRQMGITELPLPSPHSKIFTRAALAPYYA